jgi:hypothetical protein
VSLKYKERFPERREGTVIRFRRVHRRRAAAVGLTLVLFATALALWTRGGGSGNGSLAHRSPAPHGTDIAASVTANRKASGANASGDARRDASLPPFPVSTNISDYNRGPVTVTFRATGDKYIGGVAYVVEGHSAQRKYTVASPMSVSVRTPYGARTAMTVQVAPEGVTATCSIAINGVVKVTYTAHGPNQVVACVV